MFPRSNKQWSCRKSVPVWSAKWSLSEKERQSLMPRIPIFRLGQTEKPIPPRLASFTPVLSFEGLQVGVDNLRHDVHLSPKFVEQTRLHIVRLLMRHGDVEGLVAAEPAAKPSPK